jgi:ABC-type branched-subunit amino acid transport system ATPase component
MHAAQVVHLSSLLPLSCCQVPGANATAAYNSTASINDVSNATAVSELTAVFNTFASIVNGAGKTTFMSELSGADGSIEVVSAGGL